MSSLKEGMRVCIKKKNVEGYIRHVGTVDFAEGVWIGVELDKPEGKNDGSVQDKRYFSCPDKHGMFVRKTQVDVIETPSSPTRVARVSSPTKRPVASRPTNVEVPAAVAQPAKEDNPSPVPAPSDPRPTSAPTSKPAQVPASAPAPAPAPAPVPTATPAPGPSVAHEPAQSAPPVTSSLPQRTSAPHASAPSSASSQVHAPATLHQPDHVVVQGRERADSARSISPRPQTLISSSYARSHEDPARTRELETLRLQVQQMSEYKANWQQKQDHLQRQLTDAKNKEHELEVQLVQMDTELVRLQEQEESSRLDRELSEEQCRLLQEENDDLKDTVEELQLQVEIVRLEGSLSEPGEPNAEGAAAGPARTEESMTNATIESLKQKNRRLTEAVVHLRAATQRQLADVDRLTTQNSELQAEVDSLTRVLDLKEKSLNKMQQDLSSQMEQVDAGANAAETIEGLTQQNMVLEDRCQNLEEEVHDLRAMLDIESQVNATLVEAEQAAHEAVLEYESQNDKLIQAVQEMAARYAQQRTTIEAFKEKVSGLEQQVSLQADREQERLETEPVTKQAPVAAPSQKSGTAIRERARHVEHLLHALSEDQAAEHVELLKKYLAEDFFVTDYNGLLLLLLLERFSRKTAIIRQAVEEEFHADEDLDHALGGDEPAVTIEQYTFGQSCISALDMLNVHANYLREAMPKLSAEEYRQIGDTYLELAPQEGSLDRLLKHIQGDGLFPSIDLRPLSTAASTMVRICTMHLKKQHPLSDRDSVQASATLIASSSDAIMAQLYRLEQLYAPSLNTDSALGPLIGRLQASVSNAKALRTSAKKMLRSLPERNQTNTVQMGATEVQRLEALGYDLHKLENDLALCCRATHDYVHDTITLRNLDLETALQIAVSVRLDLTDDGEYRSKAASDGAEGDTLPAFVKDLLKSAGDSVSDLADRLVNGEFDHVVSHADAATGAPKGVWLVNAERMRRVVKETLDLPLQLERSEAELVELRTELKRRERETLEARTILEASKKKVEAVRHQGDEAVKEKEAEVEKLQEQVQQLKDKYGKMFAELEEGASKYERECADLRRKLHAFTGRRLGGAATAGNANSADLRAAHLQVDLLVQALSDARRELAACQASAIRTTLAELPRLSTCQPLPEAIKGFGGLNTRASQLRQSVLHRCAAVSVVDVSKPRSERSQTAKAALANSMATVRGLQEQLQELRKDMVPALRAATGASDSNFDVAFDLDRTRLQADRARATPFARIRLVEPIAMAGSRIRVGPAEFKKLHTTFA